MPIPQYDHFFQAFNEYAEIVREHATRPEHVALAGLCEKVAAAAHDLQAVWDRRCLPGYELPAIGGATGVVAMDEATREFVRSALDRMARMLADL